MRKKWLVGPAATILPGMTIGENLVVAVGAAVTKDVQADTFLRSLPVRI